jgi:glycosyltransferase involved in cell wall biosynthesis
MRIAILSPAYPLRGGIAQFTDSLVSAFSQEHEVIVFSFKRQYPGILFTGETQYVDPIEDDKVKGEFLLDSVNPFSANKTAKAINNFTPDILITAYWMSFMSPILTRVANKISPKTKKIALIHNYIPHEKMFYDSFLTKRFVGTQDSIITLSTVVQEQVIKDFPEKPVKALPHPSYVMFGDRADREMARKKLGINQDKKCLLFFGLIRSYKGLDILLEAYSKLDKDYNLLIAGECYGSFEKYQTLIDASPNKERIILHQRFIGNEDVPLYFSAADLCVLPYRSATQSGVTAVAHHFNLPVLATNVGGLHEFIHHEKNGLLVESENVDALTQGVEKCFEKGILEKFSENLKAQEDLTWEEFANIITL